MTWPAGGARQAWEACPLLARAPAARRADPAWLVAADRGRDAAGGSSGPCQPRGDPHVRLFGGRQAVELRRHLPERRVRSRARYAGRRHGKRFGPAINTLLRPAEAAERKRFGRGECDLIRLRQSFGETSVTSLVERPAAKPFSLQQQRQSRRISGRLVGVLQAPCPVVLARSSSTVRRRSTLGPTSKAGIGLRPRFVTRNHPGRKTPSRT